MRTLLTLFLACAPAWGQTNLLTSPNDIRDASWGKTLITTPTASTWVDDGTGGHILQHVYGLAASTTYTISFTISCSTATTLYEQVWDSAFSTRLLSPGGERAISITGSPLLVTQTFNSGTNTDVWLMFYDGAASITYTITGATLYQETSASKRKVIVVN